MPKSTASGPTCKPTTRGRPRAPLSHARVAEACKALGDENRLAMVHMIAEAGELCACDIEAHFELSQPTISHHLKLLRQAGLIEGERRGSWVFYRVVDDTLAAVARHPVLRRR